jgi:hypothetical protein
MTNRLFGTLITLERVVQFMEKHQSDDSKVIIWPQWSKQIKTKQNKTKQNKTKNGYFLNLQFND